MSTRLGSCLKMRLQRAAEAGRLAGRAGQATLEYLLLVIIVVILILSLLYQFHDSFRIYAEAFFDGYVRCLLETGELPGTGSVCAQEFAAFDAKSGKALLKNNLPEPGTSGNGSNAATQAAAAAAKANAAAHSETSGGGGGRSAVVGRFGNNGRPAVAAVGKMSGATGGSSRAGDDALLGVSNTVPYGRGRGSEQEAKQRVETVDEEGTFVSADAKAKSAAVGKKKVSDADSLRPSRAVEQLERRPAGGGDNGDGSFTIGGLIRLLILILIIIAMIVFFGGQLLQIAKSREKGGD